MAAATSSSKSRKTSKVVSIQGERKSAPLSPGTECYGGNRHIALDGHIYQELHDGVVYWVAHLVCDECGTTRTTKYTPRTWKQVGTHRYWHPETYPPKDKTQEECHIEVLESKLVLPENEVTE